MYRSIDSLLFKVPPQVCHVWIAHLDDQRCRECDAAIGAGNLLQINGSDGVTCVDCAGYSDLVFVPSGDLALTRLAAGLSTRTIGVMQWSRRKGRSERKGILVDAAARDAVLAKVEADSKSGDAPSRFRVVCVGGEKLLLRR